MDKKNDELGIEVSFYELAASQILDEIRKIRSCLCQHFYWYVKTTILFSTMLILIICVPH